MSADDLYALTEAERRRLLELGRDAGYPDLGWCGATQRFCGPGPALWGYYVMSAGARQLTETEELLRTGGSRGPRPETKPKTRGERPWQ